MHYNEFQSIKMARQLLESEDEEEAVDSLAAANASKNAAISPENGMEEDR